MSQVPDLHALLLATALRFTALGVHTREFCLCRWRRPCGVLKGQVVGRVQEVRGAWKDWPKARDYPLWALSGRELLKGWAGLSSLRGLIHSTLNKKTVFMLMFKYLLKIKISKY